MFDVQVVCRSASGREVSPQEAQRKIERVSKIFKDYTPTWKELAKELFIIMTKQFGSEGSYMSSKWAPLSKTYAELKREIWGDRSILVASGRLYSSLTSKMSPDNILRMTPTYMEFGTSVPYAYAHQTGSRKKNLPRRDMLITVDKLLTHGGFKQKLSKVQFDRARKVWVE